MTSLPLIPATARLLVLAVALLTAGCTNTLNRAIYREKPEKVDEYLRSGADVNQADDNRGTPLIYAAQFGDLTLMKKLVDRGAKVDPIDRTGNSALSYLASGETYKNDAVAFLLAKGARPNVVNNEGHAPLHLAAMRPCKPADADRQTELLKLLVDAGADAEAMPTGQKPLHLAAFAGQPAKALDYLLGVTKDPHALTAHGYTAFTEAARGDQHDTALYLAGRGFEPQLLPPTPVPATDTTPAIDPVLSINARAYSAYGDYLQGRGDLGGALANFQTSATNYRVAAESYNRVIAHNSEVLKLAKDKRRGSWIGAMALTVVGAGVGAATGVGFFVVPKREGGKVLDDYADELERQQTELKVLTEEQTALKAKIQSIESQVKAAPPSTTPDAPKT